MATTGFWPVKSRLKEVIDYAENPDKTIDKRYVDSDLYAALQYVSNDKKTDECMYVSGINCNAKRAYERMTATKKRFGKTGGNVAYHGYQSFQTGEVTPEEAHKIGLETARRMWGKEYEIVVTTHLNTDNLHNHFVINSVSFKTGKKFENHISDHHRLREISDAVCLEYGKSVLKEAEFYGGKKKKELAEKRRELDKAKLRVREIDGIIQKLYEDNATGKISDERFATMSMSLENEQSELKDRIPALENELENAKIKTEGLQRFIDKAKQVTRLESLTPELVHEFIEKIVVSAPEYKDGKRYQKVAIYYNGVGIVREPTAEEMEEYFQEHISRKPFLKAKMA